jgi:hypothetical protein
LIDERCVGVAEDWASWFVAKGLARTFGSATAGAPVGLTPRREHYVLTNRLYRVTFPANRPTNFLDRSIEGCGLEPDVPVRCSARDLANGRDAVLDAAVKWLATSNPK